MSHNHFLHGLFHTAHRAEHEGHSKTAGFIYIVIGFFLVPVLIGVPILFYGVHKILK